MPTRRNIRLLITYDGSEFHGWQTQPGLPTIQQSLTDAIRVLTGEVAVVHGSGRTDAGVHALGQVAHFQMEAGLPVANLQQALNARLPTAIRILDVAEVPDSFHARRNAIAKLYRYRIYRDSVCPPFLYKYVHHLPYPLDEQAMAAAAGEFVGTHDFRSFASHLEPSQDAAINTVRTVLQSELHRNGPELVYEIQGTGFLRHMVRNLVGMMIEIGRGSRKCQELMGVLGAHSRAAAGLMAPARGLYLVRVDYGAVGAKSDSTGAMDEEKDTSLMLEE